MTESLVTLRKEEGVIVAVLVLHSAQKDLRGKIWMFKEFEFVELSLCKNASNHHANLPLEMYSCTL